MKKEIKYTDAPKEIEESLSRSMIIPNFDLTPEKVRELAERRAKKQVSIYLSADTIEKFKLEAKKNGSRYQTLISDVLDAYTEQYL